MVRRQVASVGHDVARAGARHAARVRPSANHLPAQSPAPRRPPHVAHEAWRTALPSRSALSHHKWSVRRATRRLVCAAARAGLRSPRVAAALPARPALWRTRAEPAPLRRARIACRKRLRVSVLARRCSWRMRLVGGSSRRRKRVCARGRAAARCCACVLRVRCSAVMSCGARRRLASERDAGGAHLGVVEPGAPRSRWPSYAKSPSRDCSRRPPRRRGVVIIIWRPA